MKEAWAQAGRKARLVSVLLEPMATGVWASTGYGKYAHVCNPYISKRVQARGAPSSPQRCTQFRGAPSSPQVELVSGLKALREEVPICSRPPCRLQCTCLGVLTAPKTLTHQFGGSELSQNGPARRTKSEGNGGSELSQNGPVWGLRALPRTGFLHQTKWHENDMALLLRFSEKMRHEL